MMAAGRWSHRGLVLAAAIGIASREGWSQVPPSLPLGGIGGPGSAHEVLPEIAPGPPPRPGLVLPPVPPSAPQERLSRGPRVYIREVLLEGNTVLPDEAVVDIVAPFLNRDLGAEDLEELRHRLTRAYVERGYINSGAVLPDQEVTDGVVRYRMVEGVLTDVVVEGNTRLNESYIRNRLLRGAGPPLNVDDLERRVQLLLQDPLIERLNVEIMPGIVPGEARLRAGVVEAKPYFLGASIANDQAPTVGSIRGELTGSVRNLTGWGDALALRYGRSDGADDGSFAWAIPVTADDTVLSVRYVRENAAVISEAFRDLDIESRTETFGIGITHPAYRTPQHALTLGLTLERRETRTFLLGESFSFTPGVVDGVARVTVLRFSQDFLSRSAEEVLALRSTLSFGLNALGATMTPQEPNGSFLAWLGQAQYVRQVVPSLQLVLRGDLQIANDPLFPLEQVAIGGVSTVRGYRENELVRDNALVLSGEARVPMVRFALPWFGGGAEEGVVQLVPFVDFGRAWNTDRGTLSPHNIGSIGLGIRWDLGDVLTAQLYYGYALRRIEHPDHDLQDEGIHFRLGVRLY